MSIGKKTCLAEALALADIGGGKGDRIFSLAKRHPDKRFVLVDPKKAQEIITKIGIEGFTGSANKLSELESKERTTTSTISIEQNLFVENLFGAPVIRIEAINPVKRNL